MEVIVFTKAELEALIDRAVVRAVDAAASRLSGQVAASVGDRLVPVEEAATIMGCSPSALRKRIARGSIPVVRQGRTVRLRLSTILK